MKKILLNFKQKEYSDLLCELLTENYEDLSVNVRGEVLDKSELVLTDDFERLSDFSIHFNEKMMYQSVDEIYKIIVRKFRNISSVTKKVVTVANLYVTGSSLKFTEMLETFISNSEKSCLINFNFSKIYPGEDLSLDNLLVSDDIDFSEIRKINSPSLQFEFELGENINTIFQKIQKFPHSYIFLDLSFFPNKRNINILNNSDLVLIYYSKAQDTQFIENCIDFISKNTHTKYIVVWEEKEKICAIIDGKTKIFNSIKEFFVYVK